jgi:uncharacterized protein
MLYRRFGRTDLKMPVFSTGGMRYQFKWNDVKPEEIPAENQRNLEATIRRSLELGINHIETARGYGSSEMQLGSILPTFKRDDLIVQTKVAPSADPKQFLDTFEKSMAYLKLDHVELLSIHGINTPELLEQSIRPGGCLDAARSLQKQGRAKWIGFSTHGSAKVVYDAVCATGSDGKGFDYVNLHWYYIMQRNWRAIEAATQRDMGVFIISPTDKGGKLQDPPKKLVDLCQPLSPILFNDLWCLSHPQIHTLSVGSAKPSDYDEHIKTLALLEQPEHAKKLLADIQAKLSAQMRATHGIDHPELFAANIPEPEQCPGEMAIGTMLWLRAMATAWDMVDYGKMRYNLLGNGGHWFPGLSAAKLDELDPAAISKAVANSPFRDRVIAMLKETRELLGAAEVKRLSTSD